MNNLKNIMKKIIKNLDLNFKENIQMRNLLDSFLEILIN